MILIILCLSAHLFELWLTCGVPFAIILLIERITVYLFNYQVGYLHTILHTSAQTSIAPFPHSLDTQWYLKFSGSVQFCCTFWHFICFSRFIQSCSVFGQSFTFLIVREDAAHARLLPWQVHTCIIKKSKKCKEVTSLQTVRCVGRDIYFSFSGSKS